MFEKNQTWQLIDLPAEKKQIRLKWVYKNKYDANGILQRCKERLMAKGYAQMPRVDYFETFSPVVRIETIRSILAIAAQHQWSVYQLNVKLAFLNGNLEEDVYVEQPRGFELGDQPRKVYKLMD